MCISETSKFPWPPLWVDMSKITRKEKSNELKVFSRSSSSSSEPAMIASSNSLVLMLARSSVAGLSSVLLIIGDETLESACLARLSGRTSLLVPLLIRLMPAPIAFVLDLAALDTEEVVEWRDERDDFAKDFIDAWDICGSWQKKPLTFKWPSQISMNCSFSLASMRPDTSDKLIIER